MKFILKNLLRRKLRTVFSVLGVGLGVSIMVALFSISDDLIGQISEALETQRGDIMVSEAAADEFASDVPMSYLEELQEIEGVANVSPMIVAFLRTQNDFDDRPMIIYYGITENNPIVRHMEMLEGRPISDSDTEGVVFGWKAWEIVQEKLDEDKLLKVGGELNLMDLVTSAKFSDVFGRPKEWDDWHEFQKKAWVLVRLTTMGISKKAIEQESDEEYTSRTGRKASLARGQMEGAQEFRARTGFDPDDEMSTRQMKLQMTVRGVCRTGIMIQDSGIYFHLKVAQIISGKHRREETETIRIPGKPKRRVTRTIPESCSWMLLEVDPDLEETEREKLIIEIRDKINVNMEYVRAVRSRDVLQHHGEVAVLQKFGLVISLIAALAGAIGILNTMTLTVYERTREIGLLLAVGWSRTRVLTSVMVEGLILSIMGGFAGVVFGYAEVQGARIWLGMSMLNTGLNIPRSIDALLLALAIGVVASLYPALRASLLTPIDALRHE